METSTKVPPKKVPEIGKAQFKRNIERLQKDVVKFGLKVMSKPSTKRSKSCIKILHKYHKMIENDCK